MVHRGYETSRSLLVSYEVLALHYKKAPEQRNHTLVLDNIGKEEADQTPLPTKEFGNYDCTFALLTLNASIIEGTIRSILSESIFKDYDNQVKKEVELGLTEPSKSQRLLQKFQYEVEVQGGWEKLKEQFNFYFDISIDETLSDDTKEAVNALFVLRNVFAHGTTLVQPKEIMDNSMKLEYPYNWQSKLQRARVHLQKNFSHDDIFDNLAEFSLPKHFLNATKTMFSELSNDFGTFPNRASETISRLHRYKFGYRLYSR